nr:MAG TPA: hypothetical protein [Caudoviricetes sp.]
MLNIKNLLHSIINNKVGGEIHLPLFFTSRYLYLYIIIVNKSIVRTYFYSYN